MNRTPAYLVSQYEAYEATEVVGVATTHAVAYKLAKKVRVDVLAKGPPSWMEHPTFVPVGCPRWDRLEVFDYEDAVARWAIRWDALLSGDSYDQFVEIEPCSLWSPDDEAT